MGTTVCYLLYKKPKRRKGDARVISHKVNCTHLLQSTVCEGVEKEGGKWGGRTCLCSLLVFYEGLAVTQLAELGNDVVESSPGAPPQASLWHPG